MTVTKETKPDGEERLPPPLSTPTTDDTVYCDLRKHDVNANEDVYEGITIDEQFEEEYIEDKVKHVYNIFIRYLDHFSCFS